MYRLMIAIGLQCVAVFLSLHQFAIGLRTDEAKYLLDIPYPHPPLGRWLIHLTESFPHHELLWRILFATLLIQVVWIVWKLGKNVVLCALWLLSASVLLQSGTVMMVVITAMQGLVFVCIYIQMEIKNLKFKIYNAHLWFAFFWLASLFTAYQAILYLPIVVAIFWRSNLSRGKAIAAVVVPIALVVLYVASNPLAAASFVNAGGQNVSEPLQVLLYSTIHSWLFAGSIALSIVGVIGMIRAKSWPLIFSFILVFLFHITSFRSYYSILFVPVLIGGAFLFLKQTKHGHALLGAQVIASFYLVSTSFFSYQPQQSRVVMEVINNHEADGHVLISGSFGHDWQYESRSPIYRYTSKKLSSAKAVVCLAPCEEVVDGFERSVIADTEVWFRN